MNKATFSSLTAAEQSLILETERPRLLEHDEDALIAVHDRVRKQRAKAVSQYRRGASARVEAKGARGQQRLGGPPRAALKAEVWETALARVSTRLATLARAEANELKQRRLTAARGNVSTGAPAPAGTRVKRDPAATRSRTKAPIEKQQAAATKSAGKRRQAARDAKG